MSTPPRRPERMAFPLSPRVLFWLAFLVIGGGGVMLLFALRRNALPGAVAVDSPVAPLVAPALAPAGSTTATLALDAASSMGLPRAASAFAATTDSLATTSSVLAAYDPAAETVFSSIVKAPPAALKRKTEAFATGLAGSDEIAAVFARIEADRVRPQSEKYPTLAAYLTAELGSRFHRRVEWAGRADLFDPQTDGRRKWEPLGRVEYVTIHHADGVPQEHPASMIRTIYVGHTDPWGRLGGADVGYHFFVDRSGNVWEGRDARKLGTHVGSKPKGRNNEGNIGVCGLGSYAHEAPPRAMREMCARLPVLIARYYGRPLAVRGHQDWIGIHGFNPSGGTDCPGRLEGAVAQARADMKQAFKKTGSSGTRVADAGAAEKSTSSRPKTTGTKARKSATKSKSKS